jgi:hypothetical protein
MKLLLMLQTIILSLSFVSFPPNQHDDDKSDSDRAGSMMDRW